MGNCTEQGRYPPVDARSEPGNIGRPRVALASLTRFGYLSFDMSTPLPSSTCDSSSNDHWIACR